MVSITTIPLYTIFLINYSLNKGLKMKKSTACRSLELPAVLLRTLRTGQTAAPRAAGAPLGVGSSVDVISVGQWLLDFSGWSIWLIHVNSTLFNYSVDTSSTAQGGGGSFKNRKPIGEVGCCESGMAERIHWWTERCLISLTLSLSFSAYLPTYLFSMYLSSYRSIYLSLFLSLSSVYLSICLPVYLWCSVIQSNAV